MSVDKPARDSHSNSPTAAQEQHHPEPAPAPTSSAYEFPARFRVNPFSIPAPLRALFARVPLHTYSAEPLPSRAPRPAGDAPILYIFSTKADAAAGRPSFNPLCLKWQTYLRSVKIPHTLRASSNHASPTGVLPFLLPSSTAAPIPLNGLDTWVSSHRPKLQSDSPPSEPLTPQQASYLAFLEPGGAIRNAWLYTLYLSLPNQPLLRRLYVRSTRSTLVQHSLLHTLQRAAASELGSSPFPALTGDFVNLTPATLLAAADRAFEALSTCLGEDEYFGGAKGAGMLDAAVFGFTHLLLSEGMGFGEQGRDQRLRKAVERWENLVRHERRVRDEVFGGLEVGVGSESAI